jgi:hypothetical protein
MLSSISSNTAHASSGRKMEDEMGKFIGYRIGVCDDAVPISTGATRDEAQAKAIRRVLSIADVHSSIGVQEKPDLTDAEFAQIAQITDDWAARHCGVAA